MFGKSCCARETFCINKDSYLSGFNNNEYIFYENGAIAYGALKELDKAIKYYDEVIYRLGSEDGKSEYMKGLLKIQLSNKEEGCNYLNTSSQKKYIDSSTGIKAIDLFNRFCN